jgi:hypothetical protein
MIVYACSLAISRIYRENRVKTGTALRGIATVGVVV